MTNRQTITWRLMPAAVFQLQSVRATLGESAYSSQREAFQETFCDYIDTSTHCASKASGISPMGTTPSGAKRFKMRWGLPGHGKSGGLRLAVVARCDKREVYIAAALLRSSDPPDEDIFAATDKVDDEP